MLGLWASKKSNRRASTATESRSWLNNVRAHERAKKGIDAALRMRKMEQSGRCTEVGARGQGKDALRDDVVKLWIDRLDQPVHDSVAACELAFITPPTHSERKGTCLRYPRVGSNPGPMLSRTTCRLNRSVAGMSKSSSSSVRSRTETICRFGHQQRTLRSRQRTYIVIPLEVVQGRMASQDGQDGALQFDPQLVAVLVSHVWTGGTQNQGG